MAPPPPSWGPGGGEGPGGVCWRGRLRCILLMTFDFFKKKPFPPPPAPLTFFPVTPESPHRGEGSARGWRARLGERGGRPWESRGEWLAARGAGTPRSGPRCCSGCGISRNLGGGAETRGGSREYGCRGRVPQTERPQGRGREAGENQTERIPDGERDSGRESKRQRRREQRRGRDRPAGTRTQETGRGRDGQRRAKETERERSEQIAQSVASRRKVQTWGGGRDSGLGGRWRPPSLPHPSLPHAARPPTRPP